MSNIFRITYSWDKRTEPDDFDEEDYVDATPLFIALQEFLAIYQGQFLIQVDDLNVQFWFDPDLSIIFEEIPIALERLTLEIKSLVELYFCEQGVDVSLILERQDHQINLRFLKGNFVGSLYANLPDTSFSVPANQFLREWVRLIQDVLDALVAMQPTLAENDSYQEYRSHLLAVKSSIQS